MRYDMKHKCDGCKYKGEHQEMMFRPFGVCLRGTNLVEAERAYKAEKCPFNVTYKGDENTARYIDVNKLKEMVEAKADTLIEGKEAFLYIAKWLDILPSADVIEVVRCKDCVFRIEIQGACDYCRLNDCRFEKNGFCSYGERKK